MKPRSFSTYLLSTAFCLLGASSLPARADGTKDATSQPQSKALESLPATRMSKETRMNLMRGFNAELVYIRAPFPMGAKGLTLREGKLNPSGEELQQLLTLWGPAAKPGDRARISNIVIGSNFIHFEINGGPLKKKKWYEHIEVSGAGGGAAPLAPSDAQANPRGSYVNLVFSHFVPDLSPQQLKDLLYPVFDFNSKSAVEAYVETVPPKVKVAILNHQVLVGMNREMVLYSKGHAPKKIREKDGETEYEDWIYGEPPQDVDFIRLIGDEVVRVETMKVNGEKVVKTERELELPSTAVAKADDPNAPRPANAPSLRRPGEEMPRDSSGQIPSGSTAPLPLPPDIGDDGKGPSDSPGPTHLRSGLLPVV